MEAIILAGGFGTRLGELTKHVPKPMLEVAGRPFITHLLDRLANCGCDHAVLSVGYLADRFVQAFGDNYRGLRLDYALEDHPLGTGGAMINSLRFCSAADVLILNGDTYVDVDYQAMLEEHLSGREAVTVGVCAAGDTSRYGTVRIDDGKITAFLEKGCTEAGWINAGIYIVNVAAIRTFRFSSAFSMERDLIEKHLNDLHPKAFELEGRFIDIGVPEDYARAQKILQASAGGAT